LPERIAAILKARIVPYIWANFAFQTYMYMTSQKNIRHLKNMYDLSKPCRTSTKDIRRLKNIEPPKNKYDFPKTCTTSQKYIRSLQNITISHFTDRQLLVVRFVKKVRSKSCTAL